MKRVGYALLFLAMLACNNNAKEGGQEEESSDFSYENFSKRFRTASLPYQLPDSVLLTNKDTAVIRNINFNTWVPDSIKQKLGGKAGDMKLIPMVKIEVPKKESYYILKAVSGNRQAALMVVFDKDEKYSAAFPFLVPDKDAATTQVSSIDKAYSVTRGISRKTKDDILIEGRDAYVYNSGANDFTLIMTDELDEGNKELINPIDTFARHHKFAGDYVKDKRNLVSVRDGRSPDELMVFIHFEKNKGECIGDLKGSVLMTSSTTAVYRQGGDPCVLELKFASNSVTLNEVEGCGSHRDVSCFFEGTFPRKKVKDQKPDKTKG